MRRTILAGGLLALLLADAPAQGGHTPPMLTWPRYSPNYWPQVENWSGSLRGALLAQPPRAGGPAVIFADAPRPALVIDTARLKPADAPRLFWRGYDTYWQRDYAAAKEYFAAAVKLGMQDARLHYYKGLTELAMGDQDAAAASLKRGAELQRQNRPSLEDIGLALERVQGPARLRIRAAVEAESGR